MSTTLNPMFRVATYTFFMALSSIALFLPETAMAQGPGNRGGGGRLGMFGGGGLLGVLQDDAAQAELKLSEEQKKLVSDLREKMTEESSKLRELFGKMREATDEERAQLREEMTELTKEISKKTETEAAKILDDMQFKRLKQLSLRRTGVRAMLEDDEAKTLALTDEQKEKISEILAANRPGRGEGNRLSREERMQQREEMEKKVMAVLTDEQKTKWKEMIGAEPAPAN